ncbi:MAG TPA: DUF5989 family protein [Xanthobacteraceae bacterium]
MDFALDSGRFMRIRKKFWLLPILLTIAVFGGLVMLTQVSTIAGAFRNRNTRLA